MKKFITPLFLKLSTAVLILCLNSAIAQTTIYTTNFGTIQYVNPPNWSFSGIGINISNNASGSGYTGASGNCYLGEGNSITFTNTSGNSQVSSPTGNSAATLTVSTIGYTTVTLSFGMRKSSGTYNSNATYTLEWSTNGTIYTPIVYTEASAGSWGLTSGAGLTLPAGAGNQATLYFKWSFNRIGISSNFKIDDVTVTGSNGGVGNTAPTIVIDVASTTNYLDGAVATSPASPYGISGVISDPTDPATNLGIDFTINDSQTAASSLTVTVASSNLTVVPASSVILAGSGASRNVKINPIGVGFSNITVAVTDGSLTTNYILNYGASAIAVNPPITFFPTGMSDASDGIPLDDNFFISADDELDVINVYSRANSGLPVAIWNYTTVITLPDPTKPETDIEAATTSPSNVNKKYILGSMSTGGSSFSIRPSRDCLLSTIVSGTGSLTTFSLAGYYTSLRGYLVSWGDSYGYNFSASAAAGVDSKSVSGYAAEGMVFGPDNTTLWIAFRAPMVPVATRTNAVIAPIANFETWYNNGSPSGAPSIGTPIELDLGGRGIRDIIRLSTGTYIIVAGNSAGSPITSALYKWTGSATNTPIYVNTSVNGVLNIEGVMEVNVSGVPSSTQLQVITDMGGDILYNDGNAAKDFTDLGLRKFRVDKLTGLNLCLTLATPTITQSGASLSSSSGPSYQWYYNTVAVSGATLQNYTAAGNGNYYIISTNSVGCSSTSNVLTVSSVGLQAYSAIKNALIAYPNPFSENTTLQLSLTENTNVIIEIYTILGQKINTLTNSNYGVGIHNFTFGAKKLGFNAGVYFVKTTINGNSSVLRIIETN